MCLKFDMTCGDFSLWQNIASKMRKGYSLKWGKPAHFLEAGYHAAWAGVELIIYWRMTLNSPSCLCLP